MKNKFKILLVAILGVFMLGMTSCVVRVDFEPDYEVYTMRYDYREFVKLFNTTIPRTNCVYDRISSADWDYFDFEYYNRNDRHYYTESEIDDWLYSKGLTRYDAGDMADWLISVNHGYVAIYNDYSGWVYVIAR